MMAQKHGRIVMIGSIAARAVPQIAGAAYVASKSGLAGLTRAIAAEYATYGITANNVSPGNIVSNMTGDANSPANLKAATRIPVGRIGQPSDIANMVSYLCSDAASFINGSTFDVTGGEYMTS